MTLRDGHGRHQSCHMRYSLRWQLSMPYVPDHSELVTLPRVRADYQTKALLAPPLQ